MSDSSYIEDFVEDDSDDELLVEEQVFAAFVEIAAAMKAPRYDVDDEDWDNLYQSICSLVAEYFTDDDDDDSSSSSL